MQLRGFRRATVAGSALALLAAGCAGGGGSAESADSIKVVMAQYSDNTQGFWTDAVKEFENANPKIDVKLQVIDWNTLLQQVPTWTQTRTLPDVLNFNAYSQFASEELLHATGEVTSENLRQDFVDTLAANGELNGTSYAVPFIASVRSLGYNKEIFAEIGVKNPPTTWDELKSAAKKAQQAGYTGYCLPLGSEEAQGEWSLWAWSNGGGWKQNGQWAINSAKNVETLKFLRNLANEAKVTQPNPGKTNRTDGCWQSFAQGKVAMTAIMPLGTFQKSYMKGSGVEWDSAPFPRSSADIPEFTLGVTDFLMAFEKPGNTKPVSKFMSFVFEQDRYVKFLESEGFLPTTESASKAMADDKVAGPGIELLPSAKFYPATDPAWNRVQSAVQSQLGTAMEPGADPAEILGRLQQTAEQAG